MMHLFISDMDGTLLDRTGTVSKESAEIINNLIEQGLIFTAATARTPLSALALLEPLHLTFPIILMNGALIYSPNDQTFSESVGFGKPGLEAIAGAEKEAGIQGMLFSVSEGNFKVHLGEVEGVMWDGYFNLERVSHVKSISQEIDHVSAEGLTDHNIVYALYMDNKPDRIQKLYDCLAEEHDLVLDHYKDVYTENRWCLEISSANASKGKALRQVIDRYQVDHTICFGDSWNDVPMFECCDEGYAVANASDKLKAIATGVIESNEEHGVAHFMRTWWNQHK